MLTDGDNSGGSAAVTPADSGTDLDSQEGQENEGQQPTETEEREDGTDVSGDEGEDSPEGADDEPTELEQAWLARRAASRVGDETPAADKPTGNEGERTTPPADDSADDGEDDQAPQTWTERVATIKTELADHLQNYDDPGTVAVLNLLEGMAQELDNNRATIQQSRALVDAQQEQEAVTFAQSLVTHSLKAVDMVKEKYGIRQVDGYDILGAAERGLQMIALQRGTSYEDLVAKATPEDFVRSWELVNEEFVTQAAGNAKASPKPPAPIDRGHDGRREEPDDVDSRAQRAIERARAAQQ